MNNILPTAAIEACKELALVAKKHNLNSFSATIKLPYEAGWNDDVTLRWESGRHGDDACRLDITSTVHIQEKLEVQAEPEPVYHLKQYGTVSKAEMEQYISTGVIRGRSSFPWQELSVGDCADLARAWFPPDGDNDIGNRKAVNLVCATEARIRAKNRG